MNAPDTSLRLLQGQASAESAGLRSLAVVDKVSAAVNMITGLVVGFGAVVNENELRLVIESLGRSDAHLVLEEINAKGIVAREFATYNPELHALLVSRKKG